MKKYEKTGYLHHDFKIFHLTDHEMSAYDFHYHDFHKLLFFLSGNVTYCIEGKSYQLTPGDLVLVRAGEVHRPVIHDTTPYERMIIYVSPDFAVKMCIRDRSIITPIPLLCKASTICFIS